MKQEPLYDGKKGKRDDGNDCKEKQKAACLSLLESSDKAISNKMLATERNDQQLQSGIHVKVEIEEEEKKCSDQEAENGHYGSD